MRKFLSTGLTALAVGLSLGFVTGVCGSIYAFITNDYLSNGMMRVAALKLCDALNRWILIGAALSLSVLFAGAVMRLIALASWRLILAKSLEIRVKAPGRLREIAVVLVGLVLFCSIGWYLNRHYLPYKFHPISLGADVVLLLAIFGASLVFLRVPWTTLARSFGRFAIVSVALAVLLNVAVSIDARVDLPSGPNLIIVLSDTLRRDHLGCYGYERDTSPNIDKFAERSRVFVNAFAQAPSTKPSIASIFTSRYPSQHGTIRNESALSPKHVTLAEFLAQLFLLLHQLLQFVASFFANRQPRRFAGLLE